MTRRLHLGTSPSHHLRAALLVAVVAFTSATTPPSRASVIASTLPVDTSIGYGGFYIGAYDIGPTGPYVGPDGLDRIVVAQSFGAFRDYTDISGEVLLAGICSQCTNIYTADGLAPALTLALMTGGPGGPTLAATSFLPVGNAATYQFSFSGIDLIDGDTYWLVASSNLLAYGFGSANCCSGSVPIWVTSPIWGGAMAYSQNSGPWVGLNRSMAFAMYGTVTGDSIANGDGVLPEPTTLALVGAAVLGVAATRRRKLAAPTT